jgi:hypothetical protein
VAGVEHLHAGAVRGGGTEEGCRDEPSHTAEVLLQVEDEAEHGRCSMECAVVAEESLAGEEATPWFADEGGACEVRRVIWREGEEDLRGHVGDCPWHQGRRLSRPFRRGCVHGLLACFPD